MKRVPSHELLDTDSGTPAEIAASLADLGMINRRFGGIATTCALLRQVTDERAAPLQLLEVAAGSGAVPRLAVKRLQAEGLQFNITLLDRAPSHLNLSRDDDSAAVVGDALALPFTQESFDLVSCSLFVHHLAPEQVVQFVNEGLRVCRRAVLINDLVRHSLHLAAVYAGLPLFGSRITRHDAPASVRQAYTVEEMRQLLAKTTAARVEIRRHYLFRMGAVVWKKI